jgi:hypothetical protein
LFEKISELQRDLAASVAQLVTNQDLSHRLEGKADRSQINLLSKEKASADELKLLRDNLERLQHTQD